MSATHDTEPTNEPLKAHDGGGGVTHEPARFLLLCPPSTPVGEELGDLYRLYKTDRDEFYRRVRDETDSQASLDEFDGGEERV